MNVPVELGNDDIRVVVTPHHGCSITQVISARSGAEVLATMPWDPLPPDPVASGDPAGWIARYPGGWQLLLPNGGDPCVVDGVAHGFHGEASTAAWEVVEARADGLEARLALSTMPLEVVRHIRLDGASVDVVDEVVNRGTEDAVFMWMHHPGFGGALLHPGLELQLDRARVRADADYDPAGNLLEPGSTGRWPRVPARDGGMLDLSHPVTGSLLCYVNDLAEPSVRLSRPELAATIDWDGPFAGFWMWWELGGTHDAPWGGAAHVIGIEPSSTLSGHGLARARSEGADLVRLGPGARRSGRVTVTIEEEP